MPTDPPSHFDFDCPGCGYALSGLPQIGRCPECGGGFDKTKLRPRLPPPAPGTHRLLLIPAAVAYLCGTVLPALWSMSDSSTARLMPNQSVAVVHLWLPFVVLGTWAVSGPWWLRQIRRTTPAGYLPEQLAERAAGYFLLQLPVQFLATLAGWVVGEYGEVFLKAVGLM